MLVSFFFLCVPFSLAYLMGAIPSGWLIAFKAGINDITNHGSGNIGATNVGRALGLKYFIFVLMVDCFKAFLFIKMLFLFHYSEVALYVASAFLLLGNGVSIFLRGKGGKGIATSLGILCALRPEIIIYVFGSWFLAGISTRNMGISSVSALITLPCFAVLLYPLDIYFIIFTLFLCFWGLWRHETNIRTYCASH